jgi:hypothetical protein
MVIAQLGGLMAVGRTDLDRAIRRRELDTICLGREIKLAQPRP